MSISAPFIRRPIATALLALGVALAGITAYLGLPVAPLPRVDFPTIFISASQPGADPAVMAASVAAPLERPPGAIGGGGEGAPPPPPPPWGVPPRPPAAGAGRVAAPGAPADPPLRAGVAPAPPQVLEHPLRPLAA